MRAIFVSAQSVTSYTFIHLRYSQETHAITKDSLTHTVRLHRCGVLFSTRVHEHTHTHFFCLSRLPFSKIDVVLMAFQANMEEYNALPPKKKHAHQERAATKE